MKKYYGTPYSTELYDQDKRIEASIDYHSRFDQIKYKLVKIDDMDKIPSVDDIESLADDQVESFRYSGDAMDKINEYEKAGLKFILFRLGKSGWAVEIKSV